MVTSHDIPGLLGKINNCLVANGVLHLTLIDPLPVASSMGPCMHAWMENNLLHHLERRFRCINPTRLFPQWLSEAELRGVGSELARVKFLAIPPRTRAALIDESLELYEWSVNDQLSSIAGRMLWMEVWGVSAKTNCWWWHDPDCVAECRRLKTYWEYTVLEAVKES